MHDMLQAQGIYQAMVGERACPMSKSVYQGFMRKDNCVYLSQIPHTGVQQRVLLCLISTRYRLSWLQALLFPAARAGVGDGSAAFFALRLQTCLQPGKARHSSAHGQAARLGFSELRNSWRKPCLKWHQNLVCHVVVATNHCMLELADWRNQRDIKHEWAP